MNHPRATFQFHTYAFRWKFHEDQRQLAIGFRFSVVANRIVQLTELRIHWRSLLPTSLNSVQTKCSLVFENLQNSFNKDSHFRCQSAIVDAGEFLEFFIQSAFQDVCIFIDL